MSRRSDTVLSFPDRAAHDEWMTSTPLRPEPVHPELRERAVPSLSGLFTDLERFWPSRRGHAFDEFCR